jgi:penicillin-binding protein 2
VRIYEDLRAVQTRVTVIQYLTVVLVVLLMIVFWHLQVVRGRYYRNLAENNRRRNVPIAAPRGILLDRNEGILVDNRPSFNVVLSPEHAINLDRTIGKLSQLLQVGEAPIRERLPRKGDPPRDIVVKADATMADVAAIEARRLEFPETAIHVVPLRSYPLGAAAAHVLGHVGEIRTSQLNEAAYTGADSGDVVGQYGLEQEYNLALMGRDGLRVMIVNSRGVEVGQDDAESEAPAVGPRVVLTLDAGLHATLEKAFAGRSGAAVAIDPNNGEILAMSSTPAFDPNHFAIGMDKTSWSRLRTDPDNPLMNRVIQGQYAPGSTFKIATAIAALEEKVISPETRIHCSGVYVKYNNVFHCHELGPHGSVNVEQAIAASCNVFFYEVGVRLEIERIAKYAQALGLGSRTGVDLPGEESGVVATPKWKKERFKLEWLASETPMVAIGQVGTVTAMQLARMVAAAATGKLVTPHLVRRVGDRAWWKGQEGQQPPPPRDLGFKPETLEVVRRGMRGVTVPGGTGWRAGLPGVAVCGKTGTAQIVAKSRLAKDDSLAFQPHGWFVGFAPAEDPKIAVAILVEHAGGGGKAAAPIARELFAQYLGVKVAPLPPPADAPAKVVPTDAPTPAPTPPTPTPAVIAEGAP